MIPLSSLFSEGVLVLLSGSILWRGLFSILETRIYLYEACVRMVWGNEHTLKLRSCSITYPLALIFQFNNCKLEQTVHLLFSE